MLRSVIAKPTHPMVQIKSPKVEDPSRCLILNTTTGWPYPWMSKGLKSQQFLLIHRKISSSPLNLGSQFMHPTQRWPGLTDGRLRSLSRGGEDPITVKTLEQWLSNSHTQNSQRKLYLLWGTPPVLDRGGHHWYTIALSIVVCPWRYEVGPFHHAKIKVIRRQSLTYSLVGIRIVLIGSVGYGIFWRSASKVV